MRTWSKTNNLSGWAWRQASKQASRQPRGYRNCNNKKCKDEGEFSRQVSTAHAQPLLDKRLLETEPHCSPEPRSTARDRPRWTHLKIAYCTSQWKANLSLHSWPRRIAYRMRGLELAQRDRIVILSSCSHPQFASYEFLSPARILCPHCLLCLPHLSFILYKQHVGTDREKKACVKPTLMLMLERRKSACKTSAVSNKILRWLTPLLGPNLDPKTGPKRRPMRRN